MKPLFKIVPVTGDENVLTINKEHITHLSNMYSHLAFGQNLMKVKLQPSDYLDKNELQLSKSIISQLHIALFCEYELNIQSDCLTLGPYIGIIGNLTKSGLDSRLKDLNSYVKNYSEIGGLITAFSLDQIDLKQSTIANGYLYNPTLQKWVPNQRIPLPASLFNKCKVKMNEKWKFLSSTYQSKLFNFPTFHKWDMYQWLSQDPICKDLLPKTQICKHPKDLLNFIKVFKRAYLKPIGGTSARGIMVLSFKNNIVNLQYEKRRNIIKRAFDLRSDFNSYFKKIFRRGEYLIQEEIPLLKSQNKIIDFRLIYIKNGSGYWEDAGLFARYGKIGSAYSNLTSGGKPKDGIIALKELIPRDEVDLLYEKMRSVAKKAAETLEDHLFQCGNLGFDFGIDSNNKLWIIEINNEDPDHRIATVCKRKDILYYARLQNMLYAKRLAGFDSKKTPPEP